MPRTRPLLLCLLLGGALLRGAPTEISKEDLAELEALRLKVRENNPDVAPKPAERPTTGGTAKPVGAEGAVHVQVIRADEEGTGFELVLVLDTPVPTPAVLRGTGHAVGEKLEIEGRFEGAAKFEGAYYPFLKTAQGAAASLRNDPKAVVRPAEEPGAETPKEEEEGFGGFQITNLLFAAFGTVSLAIVGLKIKAALERRAKKKPRRR